MKILFLTDNFPPESNAPANRTYEHALEWLKKGAEVTVITCAPNFPQGKVFAGYKNRLWQEEKIDGIRVIRVWSYMSGNLGVIRRTLDYISYAVTAFFAALFVKTDIIIATSPQFFTAISGFCTAFVKRKKWIMEVRDLWPESIKAVDAIKHPGVIHFLEKIELFLYRRADKIVVVTDAFKENISQRGIPKSKIEVVKNGVLLHQYEEIPKDEILLKTHALQDKFVIGYVGTHGMAHRLDFILNCAKNVTDPAIHFLFVGDGALRPKLLQQKEELQLKNATMLPSVSKVEVKRYISLFDVALVNLRKNTTFKTVIPSKIFENAAMGKPILLGLEGECMQLIQDYDAGPCFEPENETDFIEKVFLIKNNPAQFHQYREGALNLARVFNREKFARDLLKIIQTTTWGDAQLVRERTVTEEDPIK
ncbi:MAG: glycosyltransferase family 4 protein [Saprospiraceae bacterium]